MTETWQEPSWEHSGRSFQFQLYEDVQGSQPGVFVVQPLDQQPLGTSDALAVRVELEARFGMEPGDSRLWEMTPDGNIYEHSFKPTTEYEVSQSSRWTNEPSFQRTEIPQDVATEVTGHELRSIEQNLAQEWRDLNAPQAGSYE